MQRVSRYEQGPDRDGKCRANRVNSVVHRISSRDSLYNQREVIAGLISRIQGLEEENQLLELTELWLHQTIWDLMRQNQTLPDLADRKEDEG